MKCCKCGTDLTRRQHVTITRREYRFCEGDITITDLYCFPCATSTRQGEALPAMAGSRNMKRREDDERSA